MKHITYSTLLNIADMKHKLLYLVIYLKELLSVLLL